MNFLPVLVIGVIVGLFTVVAVTSNSQPSDYSPEKIKNNALKKIAEFGDSGERIEFNLDPLPNSQEFVWVDKIIQQQVLVPITNEDGSVTDVLQIQNKTVKEKVPVAESELFIELQNRQTGETKVCKIGYQCDFTGRIILIDPNTGLKLSPVTFSYLIKCVEPYTLHCNNFHPRSDTILGYQDSTFKFTNTFGQNDPTGMYIVTVGADSKFTYYNPESQQDEFMRRTAILDVEVIP